MAKKRKRRKFVGRWVDHDGIVHVDDPWLRRKVMAYNPGDEQGQRKGARDRETFYEQGLHRNPCGRSSMALVGYVKRNAVVTCIGCAVVLMREDAGCGAASG